MGEIAGIPVINRETKQQEIEKVYGGGLMRWAYYHPLGKGPLKLLTRKFFSQLMGFYQDSSLSAKSIPTFVKNYGIVLSDFILPEKFKSFNEFFIRKYKPGKRNFNPDPAILPAFAEGRYLGYASLDEEFSFPVKNSFLTAKQLIAHKDWSSYFSGGPLLIARLCPVDYHCFHFPDDGKILTEYRVPGIFDSVNPWALKQKGTIFIENERHVTILETKNFGKLAYIEVGALFVGKIVQTYTGTGFTRGMEKGHFLFGGSTVVVVGEKGKWKPSEDILGNTRKNFETVLKLGDRAGITVGAS